MEAFNWPVEGGMSDAMRYMHDAFSSSSPFREKRKGLCRTNDADDRKKRKERARELTRKRMAEIEAERRAKEGGAV